MKPNIQLLEKPDWISWDDIKRCLYEAHAPNRANGINMTHYQWSSEKIREYIGEDGVMLVALDGKKLIGTAAIAVKDVNKWYARGCCAYVCFDAVLPDYAGSGVFRELDNKRECVAREKDLSILIFDTHSKNIHRQKIALKNGYRLVRFLRAKSGDHYSVVMVKWLYALPYSSLYCWLKYNLSRIRTIIRYPLK